MTTASSEKGSGFVPERLADDIGVVMHATEYQFQPRAVFEGHPLDAADQYIPLGITVTWRGGATWAVKKGGRVWNESANDWEYEPTPSNREDDFIDRTRYTEKGALAIAARLVQEGK